MDKLCGIYIITSPSGSIYVGSSMNVKARWHGHRGELRRGTHHCVPLQRAAQKYGIENLKFEFVATCLRENLRDLEQIVIDVVKPEYNSSKSTYEALSDLWKDPAFREANRLRSKQQLERLWEDPEFRKKQAAASGAALSAQFRDPAFREKHRAAIVKTINRVNADPAMKERAAQGRRERWAADGDLRARHSKTLGDIIRARYADPVKSAKTRKVNSEVMKKMRADPVARANNLAAVKARHCKKIVCIETGVVYESITAAAELFGTQTGHISATIRGKRKSAGGHTWRLFETTEDGEQTQNPDLSHSSCHQDAGSGQ